MHMVGNFIGTWPLSNKKLHRFQHFILPFNYQCAITFLHHWCLLEPLFEQSTVTLVYRWSLMNYQHLLHGSSEKFDNRMLLFFMYMTGVGSMVAEQLGWNTWGSLVALHLNGQKSHPLKYKHLAHNFLFFLECYFEEKTRCAINCDWNCLKFCVCFILTLFYCVHWSNGIYLHNLMNTAGFS